MDEQREHEGIAAIASAATMPPLLLERLSQAADYAATLAPSFQALSPAAKAFVVATALLSLLTTFRVVRTVVGVVFAVLGAILKALASPFRRRSSPVPTPTPQQKQQAKTTVATTTARGKGGVRRRGNAADAADPEEQEQQPTTHKPSPPGTSLKALARAAAAASSSGGKGKKKSPASSLASPSLSSSPLYLSWLKGHSDGIASVSFSSDGSLLLSCSRDRGLRQWPMTTTAESDSPLKRGAQPTPAQPRTKTLHVSPLAAAFLGGDPSKIAVLSRDGINGPTLSAIPGFSVSGRKTGNDDDAPLWVATPTPLIAGRRPVALLASSSSSKSTSTPLLAVVSEKTELETFDAETGEKSSANDTGGLRTHGACCSSDGTTVAVATFASDAKIYRFGSSQKGSSVAVLKKAGFSLSHSGQVLAVALSSDGSAAATSSKDGTWSSWKMPKGSGIKGDAVASGERAVATKVGSWRQDLPPGEFYRSLCVSPDGSVVAAAAGGDLHFLCSRTGALLEAVSPAHGDSGGDGEVTALCWAPFKRRVVFGVGAEEDEPSLRWILASGGDDRAVRLWAAPDVAVERSSGWERGV